VSPPRAVVSPPLSSPLSICCCRFCVLKRVNKVPSLPIVSVLGPSLSSFSFPPLLYPCYRPTLGLFAYQNLTPMTCSHIFLLEKGTPIFPMCNPYPLTKKLFDVFGLVCSHAPFPILSPNILQLHWILEIPPSVFLIWQPALTTIFYRDQTSSTFVPVAVSLKNPPRFPCLPLLGSSTYLLSSPSVVGPSSNTFCCLLLETDKDMYPFPPIGTERIGFRSCLSSIPLTVPSLISFPGPRFSFPVRSLRPAPYTPPPGTLFS